MVFFKEHETTHKTYLLIVSEEDEGSLGTCHAGKFAPQPSEVFVIEVEAITHEVNKQAIALIGNLIIGIITRNSFEKILSSKDHFTQLFELFGSYGVDSLALKDRVSTYM
ncbi:hypothetical protein O6P43_001710 [Quillaja saponaria]|uniref:Uncharacterized protein n=1 Tax=Quillaja saponaria TaxID=32244 RepID=A0AAD7QJK1_QUISA|nr:hypothetical protein O6P43_001710 [Quillaja saponaria]